MNFLNLSAKKPAYAQAKAVILPIPCGGLTPAALALDKGPEAILLASHMLSSYDAETNTDITELGIHTLPPLSCPASPQEAMEELIAQATQHFKKNKLVVGIGGSHLVSLGMVRAAAEKYNGLGVLHLGAHPHLITGSHDSVQENGVMARIREKCPVSHVGIRSMTKSERKAIHLDNLVFARDIHTNGLNAVVDAIDLLPEKLYVAINLDVLDPACMPAVIRPEPGGLDWYTLNGLIRIAAREKSIVGFDITGLVPRPNDPHAQLLAAKLIAKILICVLQPTL
ncbi:arginase family protein [Desulfobulbus alkaliphilus]|uniref:arginase family protein n=1 Tax=Desulfobulbus alkaliphilus TaxID=869814 RepID=UPI00196249DA|nr:arginase family protein [Desulfobulbus alkaliphilus]MBM9535587.1 arginase family protein [Desulfobulbus alkaliphilus]